MECGKSTVNYRGLHSKRGKRSQVYDTTLFLGQHRASGGVETSVEAISRILRYMCQGCVGEGSCTTRQRLNPLPRWRFPTYDGPAMFRPQNKARQDAEQLCSVYTIVGQASPACRFFLGFVSAILILQLSRVPWQNRAITYQVFELLKSNTSSITMAPHPCASD